MKTLDINLKKNGKPVLSWCPEIEEGALAQIKVVAELPFVEHISIMPDAHKGQNCPIGGVVACDGVIVPDFVGVDVSCGVGLFKTNLSIGDFTEDLKQTIHHAVERTIPTGFSHNSDDRRKDIESRFGQEMDALFDGFKSEVKIADRKEIASQLGTLGGG
jgi:tRNA-splicing ligase RtcB (3'-phosphate/5'-hydroxy nucleic acid ligase)